MLIPEVLGVQGEVAISDHRSSAPTHDELARLASGRGGRVTRARAE